jgi:large subunit ribosomal protein L13
MIVVDASNLILGRMATFVAKQALLGNEVRVINVEKAVVSGKKKTILADIKQDMDRGTPAKGPFIPKMTDRYVRRVIRGMLPYKQPKGADAYKRVLCYVGVPIELKDKETTTINGASVEKLPNLNYVAIGEVLKDI